MGCAVSALHRARAHVRSLLYNARRPSPVQDRRGTRAEVCVLLGGGGLGERVLAHDEPELQGEFSRQVGLGLSRCRRGCWRRRRGGRRGRRGGRARGTGGRGRGRDCDGLGPIRCGGRRRGGHGGGLRRQGRAGRRGARRRRGVDGRGRRGALVQLGEGERGRSTLLDDGLGHVLDDGGVVGRAPTPLAERVHPVVAANRLADVLAELDRGHEVDGGRGREAERLEVREQVATATLHLERREDDGVPGAAHVVDESEQLTVVRARLQVAREDAERARGVDLDAELQLLPEADDGGLLAGAGHDAHAHVGCGRRVRHDVGSGRSERNSDGDAAALLVARPGRRVRHGLVAGVERALDAHRLVRLLHDDRVLLDHYMVHVPTAALLHGAALRAHGDAQDELRLAAAHLEARLRVARGVHPALERRPEQERDEHVGLGAVHAHVAAGPSLAVVEVPVQHEGRSVSRERVVRGQEAVPADSVEVEGPALELALLVAEALALVHVEGPGHVAVRVGQEASRGVRVLAVGRLGRALGRF